MGRHRHGPPRRQGCGALPVALGDGTWRTLAADGTTLNRWAPHRR